MEDLFNVVFTFLISYKTALNAMDIAYKRPPGSSLNGAVPSSSSNLTLTFNNNQMNNQINALHSQVKYVHIML